MKIGRTLPPAAAAALGCRDVCHALSGALAPRRALRAREEELRREFEVAHVFPVSSGTAALTLTLRALKSLSPATEVVIPAYTCFSVPAAVLNAGLRPVLCDINPATFDFDHLRLRQALRSTTLCVIAHHLFGIPSDIEAICHVCRDRGIFVVEDAAQAMGVRRNGCKLGTMGDVGIFSFGRGKNVTCGSGGVIVTSADHIGDAVAAQYRTVPAPGICEGLKDLVSLALMAAFIRPRLYWIPAALPFLRLGETIFPHRIRIRRLSGTKAAALRGWQTKLTRSNQMRSKTSDYLRERTSLRAAHGESHPYLRLPMLVESPEQKQRMYAFAKSRGLGVSLAYPAAVSEIPELRNFVNGEQFPAARHVAANLVTFPTHELLEDRDKQALATLCQEACFAC
jgi:dTDP-4-amino-4,6-dideoxygalactose transaminase